MVYMRAKTRAVWSRFVTYLLVASTLLHLAVSVVPVKYNYPLGSFDVELFYKSESK